ncbi:MAG: PQQ-binding-like beta-propeller repeat protein [Planctomycetaceae bacterium]|nr:PQQ-binding-like beta-propeller repeat protein [Planctomycetaceae bacterium]
MLRICLLFTIAFSLEGVINAADWPAFRGPHANGITEDSAPTQWDAEKNILWKIPLAQSGNGSPIVIDGKVLLTSAEDTEGKLRSLYCYDAATGKELWKQTVAYKDKMSTHKTNPHCSTTPAAQGNRVVVWHASAGLHCYDLEGNKIWSRELGVYKHIWGYGTSPIILGNQVILNTGPGDRVMITALDLKTGKTLWEAVEPQDGTSDKSADGKFKGSWSTPIFAMVEGKTQIISVMPKRVVAYDPDSGKILWYCNGVNHKNGELSYSSAIIVGDLCYVTGGYKGPSMAIRLGGSGDVTETHRVWRIENQPQNIGSAVQVNGLIYRPNADPGILDCVDPKTGNIQWKSRGTGAYWASTIKAGNYLYATAQDTTTIVYKANADQLEEVSRNRLEAEGTCNATPAASNGKIYIRTFSHLYAIGK